MWKRLQHLWKAWGDLVHLEFLDDRLLADMGVERDELRQRVLGSEMPPSQTHPAPAVRTEHCCEAKAARSAH